MEDDITWVVSNISGATGVLSVEEIELSNWLICFGCALEDLTVVVAKMDDLMANSSPPGLHIAH